MVTCGRTVEEAREMLLDAAHELLASYRGEGREPPIEEPPSWVDTDVDLDRVRRRDLLGGLIYEYKAAT